MQLFKNLFTFILSVCVAISAIAQANYNEGYFTSEAATTTLFENVVVSIKKYNPTPEEIKNAGSFVKNAPLSYLQVPFETGHASLYGKEFESVLFCFDKNGNALWQSKLGYSKNSAPSPVSENKGFLYSGEGIREEDKVLIQKIDKNGRPVWTRKLDSLQNLNGIYVFNNRVNALVSFDHSERVNDPRDNSFSVKTYPIYFFVQLDTETGMVIKKEYQAMTNYLSSKGFEAPVINSDYSYFLHNKDSLAFFTTINQKTASIVSEKLEPGSRIAAVAADSGSCHYLVKGAKNNGSLSLFSYYYAVNQIKYTSEIPIGTNPARSLRCFLIKTGSDSILSIANDSKNIYMNFTDRSGKSSLYKKIENPEQFLPIATGFLLGVPYIITIHGRSKPGETGKIKIVY